jgi:hypothetical protein
VARRGGQRAELKGYSRMKSTQGESWATAVNLSKLGQKAACQKKHFMLIRKNYSLFLRVMVEKGVDDDYEDDDE